MTDPCDGPVCITCSDQLLRVRVDWVSDDGSMARGIESGRPAEISIELLDGLQIGEVVLVHGGVALQRAGDEGTI